MPDIFYLLSKWWKQILAVVIVSVIAVGMIVFLQPQRYLSVATAVPANTILADKARIFNNNIESLYSNIGLSDDLDVILGTARLDTVYLAVTDQFNLFDHYKILDDKNPRRRAAWLLKKYSRVIKSEFGQLQIKVWDTDKDLAPQLANSIMAKLESIHSRLQNENNRQTLQGLQNSIKKIRTDIDSINVLHYHNELALPSEDAIAVKEKVLLNQLEEYEKLAAEYQLLTNSAAPVLLIVENARPAIRPDKPKRASIIIATAFISLVFALLVALLMEKKKKTVL